MTIDYQRASELLLKHQEEMVCEETKRLGASVDKLLAATLVGNIPFDWRYNATHWALDVADVCGEIGYSIAWMRTFAQYALECDDPDRHSAEDRVSYYADNAATRISSCRDKLALLAWSYYCPFNPAKRDEVLNFEQVRGRLTCPMKFGLSLKGHEAFLAELNKLDEPHFRQAVEYRHKKVHRMEPRVMVRKPDACDMPTYMIPVVTEKDIREFERRLEEIYRNDEDRAPIREGCNIGGVLFDRRPFGQLRWHFQDFNEFAHACWISLCDSTAGSCEILLAREPMLSRVRSCEAE